MATCLRYKVFVKSSEQDKGLNADPTCERKPQWVVVGPALCWAGRKETLFFSRGKQHRGPDTTYMFVRDYSVVLIRLTMLQNIQTGGGFKAVIGGTYTGKTLLNHF